MSLRLSEDTDNHAFFFFFIKLYIKDLIEFSYKYDFLPRQFEASTCSFKKSTHIFFTGSIWYWFAASNKDWTLLLFTEILQIS